MKPKFFSSLVLMAMLFLAACAPTEANEPANPPVSSHGGAVEDQVSLMDALRAAGADVEPGDPVEQAFFSVTGQIVKVDGADVQVFEYESAEAMEADAAQVSPDGGSIGTSMVMWVEAPHFFKSGRVLVLYVGEDAAILDLLKNALGEQFAGR
ncbi:MAG: hypothetical protein HUU11_03165 [Anaerolineales bacterium]|nr:hypothetical protein [Anaerolineales bacterium]NUQ83691.1 hypothetical protein [Anaerolineales bacterium]